MSNLWHSGLLLGILVCWGVLLTGFRSISGTTLVTAWCWSVTAAIAWSAAWFTELCPQGFSEAARDHIWYGCAVLALCPPMAVLGARRPGTRVWAWFILVPMLMTLSWPILAVWSQGAELRRLQLETPQLAAFCLILVMGVGNYCGTRFTVSALLFGTAVSGIVWSSSVPAGVWLEYRPTIRGWCTAVAVSSVILVRSFNRPAAATRFDQLWFDFFDAFGIVWGRRIQDRVNYILRNDRLPIQLQLGGFDWSDPNTELGRTLPSAPVECADRSLAESRLEHVLRWLLRRFVDSQWIDRRLGTSSRAVTNVASVDS